MSGGEQAVDAYVDATSAGRELRCARVLDGSMAPEIKEGEHVVFAVDRAPLDGELVIGEYGGAQFLRRWWSEGDDVDLATNNGDVLRLPKAEVTVLGVVISGVYEVKRRAKRTEPRAPDLEAFPRL